MSNLEHAKSLIERAKQQADDWEAEEAAVTFTISLMAGLIEDIDTLLRACVSASHALRSFQHGNSSTDFAKDAADYLDTIILEIR
jgi:hypothetical protein